MDSRRTFQAAMRDELTIHLTRIPLRLGPRCISGWALGRPIPASPIVVECCAAAAAVRGRGARASTRWRSTVSDRRALEPGARTIRACVWRAR